MNKTNNQTTVSELNTIIKKGIQRIEPETVTQKRLEDLQNQRNKLVPFVNGNQYFSSQFESINTEIITTIAEIACYKTLKLLMSKNATNSTETETTENGQVNTYGYNMSLKLFNNLYNDIKMLHNPEIITDIFTDSADLLQVAKLTLIPYFNNIVVFGLDDVLYTHTLKNGNVKNYNAFQLACKSSRAYIQNQDKKQYKRLAYCIGFTDSGAEVLTTKKPENDITDIETESRKAFVNKYPLTNAEQTAILNHLNGLSTTESAEQMQVSKRTIERALKSAREKIQAIDKRIKL
jgi:hypothetical protein